MKTYFISDGTCVKIGKSNDPVDRLRQLQTAHSKPLSLIAVAEGDHEGICHILFSSFRKGGEWFELPLEYVQLIVALTAKAYNRCIGIGGNGKRCKRPRQPGELFCDTCPVGAHLFLSDESYTKLAAADWETFRQAERIVRGEALR